MSRIQSTVHQKSRSRSLVAEHEVLRNTYCLLGISLIISACCAFASMVTQAHPGLLVTLVGIYGLLFLVQANSTNAFGICLHFYLQGLWDTPWGHYLIWLCKAMPMGRKILLSTTACTGTIFLSLSAYVLTTKQDFSYMGGFLFILLFTGIIMSLLNAFMGLPILMLMTSSLFVLVFSGLIMYHTSEIIHGGERNYILATVSLFLAIYNLFVHLLHLFMMLSGRRD